MTSGGQWAVNGNGPAVTYTNPAGWVLERVRPDGGGWWLTDPAGVRVRFETDGGLYLAIDMANAYIAGRTTLDGQP